MMGENADSKKPTMKRKAYICLGLVAPACAKLGDVRSVENNFSASDWIHSRKDRPSQLADDDTGSWPDFQRYKVGWDLHDSE